MRSGDMRKMILNTGTIGYAAIIGLGMALAVGVHFEIANDYEAAKQHYVEAAGADAQRVSKSVQDAFRSIYENVRTLTFLPSIRKIDRHGTNLGGDGREAIQQVYNNLASSVSVSEVYIVPADLD